MLTTLRGEFVRGLNHNPFRAWHRTPQRSTTDSNVVLHTVNCGPNAPAPEGAGLP